MQINMQKKCKHSKVNNKTWNFAQFVIFAQILEKNRIIKCINKE